MMKTCKWCGEVKDIDLFYRHPKLKDGRRPECKTCSNRSRRKREEENPLETTIHKLSYNIVKRTILDVDKPKNGFYKRNGIKCLLGDNVDEVRRTLTKHYRDDVKRLLRKGEKPSVDRIDPKGHYELGNIQIVSLEENLRRSDKLSTARNVIITHPDGKTTEHESVKSASLFLECKRDTIYHGAKNPGTNRKGYEFIIEQEDE